MIIPSHIPNVPKWVTYEKGNKIAWLNPTDNRYYYHFNNEITFWARETDITAHMKRYPDIYPLTSLGYIILRLNKADSYIPPETIKMYIKDLLETINKENLKG